MCTIGHDERAAGRVRGAVRACVAAALVLLASSGHPPRAASAEDSPAPVVVWTGGGRIYVASPDSGALAPRMRVRVLEKGHEIARGEITAVIDGILACVTLTGGGVRARTRLDRLEVAVEPAETLQVQALRVGLPAPSRRGLVPPCAESRLDLAALPRAYRAETLAVDAVRLVAADSALAPVAWPETLLVRFFGDRADEEIALERGELDLAVFWPGEPSARSREGAFGREAMRGTRSSGMLAVTATQADSSLGERVAPDLAALNAELFGGDLLPLRPRVGADSAAPGAPAPAGSANRIRYVVDAAMPGQRTIERFLNRRAAAVPRAGDRTVRLAWLDAPVAGRDSAEAAWRERGAALLFALRCPVLCTPARAADVRALGADAFANLSGCGAAGARP